MPIEFSCPSCQKQLRVPDTAAGRQARCPSCSTVVTVPEPQSPSPSDYHPPGHTPPAMGPSDANPPNMGPPNMGPPNMGPPNMGPPGVGGGAPPQQPSAPNPFVPQQPPAPNPYAPQAGASSNPFQSPSHMAYDEPTTREPGTIGHERIAFDDVLGTAWEVFKSQWGMACVVMLLIMVINGAIGVLGNVVNTAAAATGEPAVIIATQILLQLVIFIPQTWLGIGQMMIFFEIARGRELNIGTLFKGGPYLLRVVGASLLTFFLIGGVIGVVAAISAGSAYAVTEEPEAAAAAGVLAGFIGYACMIVPILMISQYYGLIIDNNQGAIESLTTSMRITQGNKVSLFVIVLLWVLIGFGCMIVGFLALCIGIIPAMLAYGAYSSCLWVVTYLKITGQPITLKPPTPPYRPPTNY